jgi:spermidine/putrescine-binding protein
LLLALVTAACGGNGEAADGGSDDSGTAAEAGDTVECEVDQVDGDLNFYNWSEYMDPELITAFEAQYSVDIVEDFYESNEAMLAQVDAGVSWDVIVPSDYMVGVMIANDLLLPLDKDAIPNIANLAERFQSPPYDPELAYTAAYQYGTTGLGVNTAIVGEDFEPSWSLLFDPALTTTFAGGVSVLNDPRETIGAALKYLGYSLNSTNLDELQEAADVISAAKEGIATFDSDQYDEQLANGDVAVSHGYSGNMIVGFADAENPDDFVYVLPDEGATLWIDNMAIPRTVAAPCSAHTFLNYLLDADNGATLTNWNYYGSPNGAAIDAGLIEQEVIDFYAPTDTAEDLEVITNTGDFEINFTDYFAQAKG